MRIRRIYCPGANQGSGGWVPLSVYVKAIRLAKANPDRTFSTGLTCWWSCTGAEIMQQFRRGLHDRVNHGVPYTERGM